MVRNLAKLAVVVSLTSACSGDSKGSGGAPAEAKGPTYFTDVRPILQGKCVSCHHDGGIAPFALDTYAQAVEHAEAIRDATAARIMPPWLAAPGVREYRFDASLTDAQIETIGAWVDAEVPEGDRKKEGAPITTETSELPRVDAALKLPEPYTPQTAPNEYRCFVLDWPYDHPVYVTGFNARPGNPAIVHHIQAYLAPASDAELVRSFDDGDPGPGYSCFGAPNPSGVDPMPVSTLGGWTPGRGGMVLPEGTGIRIDPGAKVLLQLHYHSSPGSEESDQTTLEMTVEESVTKQGYYIPWTDSNWAIDPKAMLIPAGAAETVHSYVAKPEDSLVFSVFSGGMKFPDGFMVHTVYPHAHKLARVHTTKIVHADRTETLVDIPSWNFDWQREYVLSEPAFVAPGDQLGVSCTWSNTPADQPMVGDVRLLPHDVTWGEGTEDEMCSAILYATAPD